MNVLNSVKRHFHEANHLDTWIGTINIWGLFAAEFRPGFNGLLIMVYTRMAFQPGEFPGNHDCHMLMLPNVVWVS
jgi:hypothetical protein